MADFNGTLEAFKRNFGPHLRVMVQQLTKKHKASVGACQHCGASIGLEAAHLRGRDRTDIINILLATNDPNALVEVNLKEFEEAFKREHVPLEKSILVLCRTCHSKYDTKLLQHRADATARSIAATHRVLPEIQNEILPITLDPPHPEDFKTRLLKCREAVIEIHYATGGRDQRSWNAYRFSTTSNVFGNLRSRPEFRQGRWQEMGIVKVCVRVVD